jgi:spore coat protein U-like protein
MRNCLKSVQSQTRLLWITLSTSLLLLCACFLSVASVHAGTTTGTTKATATLASTCQLNVPNIVFGNLTLGAANSVMYQAETLSVLCSKNAPYTLNMSFGNNASHPVSGCPADCRYLAGSKSGNTDVIFYNIATTTAYNTVWSSPYTHANVTGTGSGAWQQINYEAAIQTSSWVTPDNYSDNLTLTVSY